MERIGSGGARGEAPSHEGKVVGSSRGRRRCHRVKVSGRHVRGVSGKFRGVGGPFRGGGGQIRWNRHIRRSICGPQTWTTSGHRGR